MEAHVSDEKKKVVKEFVDLIVQQPIVAAVNMENLPAKQLQRMRERLRGSVIIRMTKRRLLLKAFEQAEKQKPGVSQLVEYLRGMPALLFTDQNPFTLYKTLKRSKSMAPIKAGQTAPNDIVVPAGPTSFAPGPIIGELGQFGIKTGIEDGKVAVKADAIVAKEGDVVSQALAGVLTRMGIEPMEVGLDVTAAFEDGMIYTKQILDVDEDAFLAQIVTAASESINLSFTTGYPTKETIELMLRTCAADALALALERDITTDATTKLLLAKAAGQAAGVAATVPAEAMTANAPAEKTEEKKTEEKPAEEKTEDAKQEEKPKVAVATEAEPETPAEEKPGDAPKEETKPAEEAEPAGEEKKEEAKEPEEKPDENKEEKGDGEKPDAS